MRPILKGSTDQSVVIRIVDSADGTPETGVVFDTAGIDLWYRREGGLKVSITEATLASLDTAHADGGFLHIGDGYYRLDLPDAAVATGADGVAVGGTVTGMVVVGVYVPLVAINVQDAVRLGLTALPNAAADAAGGLPISDAGGLDIDALNTSIAAILVDTAEIGTAGAGLTNINLPDQAFNLTGNITGNLSGTVGSVTGAVGSVTGAVGSVTGNVGGITGITFPLNFADMAITATTGIISANAIQISGSAPTADKLESWLVGGTITPRPKVDADYIGGSATAGANLLAAYNGTGYAGGTIKQRVVDGSGNAIATASAVAAVKTETAAILEDTGTTIPGTLTTLDAVADGIKVTTDKLDDTLEDNAGTHRFTEAALAEGPSGGGGTGLTAQEVRDAMKLAPTAGDPAAGSVDKHLDDIEAKTGAIGAQTISLTSPISEAGEIEITRNRDYSTGGYLATATVASYSGPSLVGGTLVLRAMPLAAYNAGTGDTTLEVTGTISIDGTTLTLTAPITAADTAGLDAVPPDDKYNMHYEWVATTSGDVVVSLGTGALSLTRELGAM